MKRDNLYVTTAKFDLESGITIMAAGCIIDGEVEFYEIAGVITDDNIMEIIEKFKELYSESRKGLQ